MNQPSATLIGAFVIGALALIIAAILFFGGGAWTLRDGLRLRRELLRS